MNNFTKYICAGLAIALLIIQAIMIWGFIWKLQRLSERIVRLHKKSSYRS